MEWENKEVVRERLNHLMFADDIVRIAEDSVEQVYDFKYLRYEIRIGKDNQISEIQQRTSWASYR